MNLQYNSLTFAIEVLKALAKEPCYRKNLTEQLELFLEQHQQPADDVAQKLTRTIRKLRDCGFEIESAPHHPYVLKKSIFPVILSADQRQALYLATHLLEQMGFSQQAGQLQDICPLTEGDRPTHLQADFNPPVDYSDTKTKEIIINLQKRLETACRFTIRYHNSFGEEALWDLDRSELRLHNGSLYLFAYVPDILTQRIQKRPNIEQNVLFRIDRILSVNPSSNIHWLLSSFPTLKVQYRMTGSLSSYNPRRHNETVIQRNVEQHYVEIETNEDCLFWFRQRILQYGSNVRILTPQWLHQEIVEEHLRAIQLTK
jgi:predicted DNA-binding transcriptional regulator YafY